MSLKVNFLGDIGIFETYEKSGIDPFNSIELPESDLNIGNFEFMVPLNRNKYFYDVQEHYSCSYNYLRSINTNKFSAFGFANNHSLDYGLEGALDTIGLLRQKSIECFGFSTNSEYSTGTLNAEGIKIGIIGCVKDGRWSKSIHGYGPDSYDPEKINDLIIKLKKTYHHVIVFPHWGTELIEIPLKEDINNAKKFIDTGASAVIGHHPHVSQGIEEYKDGIIAYSLGSFIYLHEEELGYSRKDQHRHLSICMNIEFTKEGISTYTPYYYKYNMQRRIPEPVETGSIIGHVERLNSNINNQKEYKKQFYKYLMKREMRSFWTRFKNNPYTALRVYIKFIIGKIYHRIIQ
jgi:hypothetical protein